MEKNVSRHACTSEQQRTQRREKRDD